MLSTALELLGLAALVAAAYVLGGLGATLIVGGVELLFLGYAISEPNAPWQRSKIPSAVLTNEKLEQEKPRVPRPQPEDALTHTDLAGKE